MWFTSLGLTSSRPIAGNLLPHLRRRDNFDAESELRKLPFKLSNASSDQETDKGSKPIDPHKLGRIMFPLGVSLIEVNVNSSGGAGQMVKFFSFFPPLRHALYAKGIADGASNFVIGVLYASCIQAKDFFYAMSDEETSYLSLWVALLGIWTQIGVYFFYGLFSIPIGLFKLATLDKEKLQGV